MSYILIHKYLHQLSASVLSSLHLSVAMLVASAVLLSGCSDDDAPFKGNDISGSETEVINFSVRTSDSWNNGSSTRVASGSRILPSLTLTVSGSDDKLYLHPLETEGIEALTKKSSRSVITTNSNIEDFGVYASMRTSNSTTTGSPDFMYNEQIKKESGDGNIWIPSKAYKWPGDGTPLHINSYSPYRATPDVEEGIISLPGKDATGPLTLSWITPEDVADQYDLMYSTPVDASSSPCDLTFNHALTAIKFVAGEKLSTCQVKSIQITDVVTSGTLNLEDGSWTLDENGKKTFTVAPDLTLDAGEGSSYVAAGTDITSGNWILLLPPQSFASDDAEIILTIEIDGKEYSFNASLNGQTWTAGKTVTYRLSASPSSDSLIFDILDADGKSVKVLKSHYTGVPLDFSVVSNYKATDGGQTITTPMPWKAEFIDDNGNTIGRPEWITDFVYSGKGDGTFSEPTMLQTPSFTAMSEDTQTLRAASDINSTSGISPYNLANSTGAPTVENTANCYVISAPGSYSLPLVYGNAIKNGATNSASYTYNGKQYSSRVMPHILINFINHLGNPISDPYIYNNSGCTPSKASVVWEGRLGLITDVALSDDKKSLLFNVPESFIRQGDAVIAVHDNDGKIMWSWHIWITPHKPDDDVRAFTYSNHTYHVMAHNIGELQGGDKTLFEAKSITVRFTQTDENGNELQHKDIIINRDSKIVETPFCYSYFQWGRKDAFVSFLKEWYLPNNEETDAFYTKAYDERDQDVDFVANCIYSPDVFWTAQNQDYDYINLWSVNATNVDSEKSIYDPSPVGFKIPGMELSAFMTSNPSSSFNHTYISETDNPLIRYTLDDGTVDFPLLGYRSGKNGGNETTSQVIGPLWMNTNYRTTSMMTNLSEAFYIPFGPSTFSPARIDRSEGYGIRPIKDE